MKVEANSCIKINQNKSISTKISTNSNSMKCWIKKINTNQ